MHKFDDIHGNLLRTTIKNKFGSDVEIYFSESEDIPYVKILKQSKYFLINNKGDCVLLKGYEEIIFANEVSCNSLYSDKLNINDDIYSNQSSSVHIEFNKDLIIVKSSNKYGMFNTDGHEVLPIQYQKIIWISKDRIIICMGGKYGLSDTKGTCKIPCIYNKIMPIPLVKQYSYGYDEEYKQCSEEIKLLVAQSKGAAGYVDTGFNMNGQMIIRTCLGINLGESFSLVETFGEFPYICAEIYRNLVLELFPHRYFLLDLKAIGFDYSQYIEEYGDCIEYVCGKIADDE